MFWNVKLCRCFLYKKDVWSLLHLSSFSIKYAFIMTGRQLFNETEKVCLQELIIKYKLNSTATTCGGSVTSKKVAWARLTEEFNSIETNSKRTEMQLKKCWDNLKTRRKAMLALQKKERMRTGGGPFNPDIPSTSQSSQEILLDSALSEQTDVELMFAIDSDTPDTHTIEDMQTNLGTGAPQTTENLSIVTESVNEPSTETERVDTPLRQSESRMSDFGISAPSQVSRNIRTKVIEEEFSIRRENYKIKQKRDEELHKLKIAEHTLLVKVAEEKYLKTKIEKEAAEELLLCNKMKKEEAEIKLFELKK